MKFVVDREALLKPLLLVTGVVERRQTLPVLANLLVTADADGIALTGTDLEVSLVAELATGVSVAEPGEATIPARKLADIWRSLPDGASVEVAVSGDRAVIRSGRSRFTLATLPTTDFPRDEGAPGDLEFALTQLELRALLEQTSFAMAQQDVRYYFNGLLIEVTPQQVRAVATDGHRMAIATRSPGIEGAERTQIIVPRKGVAEMMRLVAEEPDPATLALARNHLRVRCGGFTMTTKLVDGRFPEYEKVIPRDCGKSFVGERELMRQAFHRASILSNEKYRGIRLVLESDQLTLFAKNPEQEEAEETVPVDYAGERAEVSFNVSYLQDVLGALGSDKVRFGISDANGSALLESADDSGAVYIVMPMRL